MGRSLENIIKKKKHIAFCEAQTKRPKYSRSEKEGQRTIEHFSDNKTKEKHADHKHDSCIEFGMLQDISMKKPRRSSTQPNKTINVNEEDSLAQNGKMWELVHKTRLSFLRHKPLDVVAKRCSTSSAGNNNFNTTQFNGTISDNNTNTQFDSYPFSNKSNKTQNFTNKSNLWKCNSLANNQKARRNSINPAYKNRSLYKPLDLTVIQKTIFPTCNTTTVERQPIGKLSRIRKQNSVRAYNTLDISFSSTSSSDDESKGVETKNESLTSDNYVETMYENNTQFGTSPSLRIYNSTSTKREYFLKSNHFESKKDQRNAENLRPKRRSHFKPLGVILTQKSFPSDYDTTTNEKYGDNNNLEVSFSSSSENDKSFQPYISSSPKPSQIIDTPTTVSSQPSQQLTELDLLLELIEQDDKKKPSRTKMVTQEISSPRKSCLKGGYEELFLRSIDRVKISGRYLKHDKKFGLKIGIILKIIKLEISYGIHVATVESEQYNNVFLIVIAPEMVTEIKLYTLIEAFFEDNIVPYKLQSQEGFIDLFLEPYKLLVV